MTNSITISTLGPSGTCSEYAAKHYASLSGLRAEIALCDTFEDAVAALIGASAECAIVPSAYTRLGEIIFANQPLIQITDTFLLRTPNLVLARRRTQDEVRVIAVHASPIHLVKKHYAYARCVPARSNAEAAALVMNETADTCLTTCVCAREYALSVVRDYGTTPMGWNVFRRPSAHDARSACDDSSTCACGQPLQRSECPCEFIRNAQDRG